MIFKQLQRFLLVVFSTFIIFANTAQAEEPTIKVACILDDSFFLLDESGTLGGYTYDYLQLLSQYTKHDYEFVMVDEGGTNASLDKAVDMLEQGEVDLLTAAYRNPGTETLFSFPDTHTGVSRYCLMSLASNHQITQDNYFLQESLSVALVEGAAINDTFLALFDLRGLLCQVTYVKNYEETLDLLLKEQVQTILMTDTSHDSGLVTNLTTIDRTPFYFVADKSNSALAQEINEGLVALNVVSPNTHQTLLDRYFGQATSDQTRLSQEEQVALAQYDYLTVGLIKDLPPYQSYDPETGESSGITLDILELISQYSGVEFQFLWVNTPEELEAKLESGEIDFCGTLPKDYQLAQRTNVILSEPYLTSGTTLLTRGNVQTKTALYHLVSGNIPYVSERNLSMVFDIESALIDLSEHGTASIFCDPNVANYYIHHLGLDNIQSNTLSNISSDLSLGMAKHLDVAIMALLNQAIINLDSNEVAAIVLENMNFANEVTLASFVQEYSWLLIILAFFVLTIILVVAIRNSNKFKRLARQDSMTKLINSGHFHQYAQEVTRNLQHGCLILIDIDLFKDVNDTHGHQKGDEVILIVADGVKNHFREGDMVARLGGDEFAVLLENPCKKEDLERKFHELSEKLANNHTGIQISLSIGGFIFCKPIEYKELYDLADANLYAVKESGRNGFMFTESTT